MSPRGGNAVCSISVLFELGLLRGLESVEHSLRSPKLHVLNLNYDNN